MAKTPLFFHVPFSIQHQAGLFQRPARYPNVAVTENAAYRTVRLPFDSQMAHAVVQGVMAARTIGMALAICSVGCASAPASRSVVGGSDWTGLRLYVDTRDTDNDAERRARQQSVVDLRAALAKRHGRLVLVDTPAQADITVAIVERVIADSGSSFSLFPPRYYAARNIVRLRATVTRAGESADLTGGRWRESDAQGWVLAAQDIAAAIDAWIRASIDSHSADRALALRIELQPAVEQPSTQEPTHSARNRSSRRPPIAAARSLRALTAR